MLPLNGSTTAVDGSPFSGVAREAQVSGWFVYNQLDVRAAVELAHARAEIRDLIDQRDRYRERARLALGTELEGISQQQLTDRITHLEAENLNLAREANAAQARANQATDLAQRLTAELDGARLSLRRMIRDQASGATG